MMLHAQTQSELAAQLDSFGAKGEILAFRDSVIGRSRVPALDCVQQLSELLQQLGVSADTAATRCFRHVQGATARAAASIEDWMTYLPQSCVRSMVLDGWHWST
jgi:hypothetical protein